MNMPKPGKPHVSRIADTEKAPDASARVTDETAAAQPVAQGEVTLIVGHPGPASAAEQSVAVDVSGKVSREEYADKAVAANARLGYDKVDKAIQDRAQALSWALGVRRGNHLGDWANQPAPEWMNKVIAEVKEKAFPAYAPCENSDALSSLLTSLKECSDAISLKVSKAPEFAVRYCRDEVKGYYDLESWSAANKLFAELVEHQKDRTSLDQSDRDLFLMAYDDFGDRVGVALCASLRDGAGAVNPNIPLDGRGMPKAFTDVGGYQLYYLTADNGVLSIEAVEENLDLTNDPDDRQWYVVGVEINYEDHDLVCDHTGKPIPAAYDKEPEAFSMQETDSIREFANGFAAANAAAGEGLACLYTELLGEDPDVDQQLQEALVKAGFPGRSAEELRKHVNYLVNIMPKWELK